MKPTITPTTGSSRKSQEIHHYHVYKISLLVTNVSQINPARNMKTNFSKIQIHITLTSMPPIFLVASFLKIS